MCKNKKCKVSTGIHEGLTFGSGRLDEHGYWEFPCRDCAAKFDLEKPQRIKELIKENLNQLALDWQGFDEFNFIEPQIVNHLQRQHEWAFMRAWPYANQNVEQLTKEFQEHEDKKNKLYDSW